MQPTKSDPEVENYHKLVTSKEINIVIINLCQKKHKLALLMNYAKTLKAEHMPILLKPSK